MAKKQPFKPLCPPGRPPRFEDVFFANVPLDNGTTMDLKMDIYQDLNQKEPGPCIIYYFGGGWMFGEYKQVTQKAVYCRDLIKLVEMGYTIVSPAYRLASEAIFPAAIHDCKAVVRFLKANADNYHIDSERIGILGNSAGGHLAAMVACSAGNKEMEGDVGGNTEYSSDVKAAALYYGIYDIEEYIVENGSVKKNEKKDVTGTEIDELATDQELSIECHALGYLGENRDIVSLYDLVQSKDESHEDWHFVELAKKCSPITYASENNPPIVMLHGGQDQIVPLDQSWNFYNRLLEAGADVTFISCTKAAHGPTVGKEADAFAFQFLTSRI